MSSINPRVEIITAHIPITMKFSSALPNRNVAAKNENDVASPPKGGMSLCESLISYFLFLVE